MVKLLSIFGIFPKPQKEFSWTVISWNIQLQSKIIFTGEL